MTSIAIFPAHDDNVASSRIRAHSLHRSLVALGHDARIGDARGAEVIVIQKRATPKTVALAKRARASGALVIFDVDDTGPELWYSIAPSVLRRFLQLADVVTTDTEGHRAILLRDYQARSVSVIPDTIDYYPAGPARPPLPDGAPLRVLWFGHAENMPLFERYAKTLERVPGLEIVVVTGARAIEALSSRLPHVSFVPWSRETFIGILQSCALTLLPHDGSEGDRAKSNNRMIASITWGVPAVVSRTPEYERTASEAHVGQALFADDEELLAALERLRSPDARRAYLDAAQDEVWRRYSPEAVARQFLKVVESAERLPSEVRQPGYLRWLRRASQGHMPSALRHEATHRASWMLHGNRSGGAGQ